MSEQQTDEVEVLLLEDLQKTPVPKRKRSTTPKTAEPTASIPVAKRLKESTQDDALEFTNVSKKFRTTSRSNSLVALIKNFNDDQRQAVIDIGFGGLLDLKLTSTPSAMIKNLINSFDVTSSTMTISKDNSFRLSKDDVYHVFGLPSGPSAVEYLPMGSLSAKSHIKDKWRAIFACSKGIPINKLLQKLKSHKQSDDLFKQMFVLYAMSQFLSPTSNCEVDMRLLKAVDVVEDISKIDWCSHVYSELVAAIWQFKNAPPTFLRGCFLFLMVTWFHKVDNLNSELPLIKHWDDEKLLENINQQMEPGKIPRAKVIKIVEPRLEVPRLEGPQKPSQKKEVPKKTPMEEELPKKNSEELPKKTPEELPKKRYLHIELPDDILTDEEIDAQAADVS